MRICEIETTLLQNTSYQLVLPRFPKTQFFATNFVLPDISLPSVNVATPFVNLPMAGDKPMFSPMRFNFLVNADMSNFQELHDWMHGIGFTESYTSYTQYSNKTLPHQSLGEQDAKVIVLNTNGSTARTITFFDAIPISLGGIDFDSQDQNTTYVKASVAMVYSHYKFTD